MRYRAFRKLDTSEWASALFTSDGDFTIPELSHRTSIAGGLGLSVDALVTVESDTDPRTGSLLRTPDASRTPSFSWAAATLDEKLAEIGRIVQISDT